MLRRNLTWTCALLLFAAWLAFWLVSGRYAMLDDCLIHLRYAGFLFKTHTITYDGIHRSFGTSSPLYVLLLALLQPVFSGPLLPKGLSVVAYLVLISVLVTLSLRTGRPPLSRTLFVMLTFCLACPMGIRWLTDGMETPLQVLFVVLLALFADRQMHSDPPSLPRALALMLLGFLMTTLRIESATLLFLVSLAIFLNHAARRNSLRPAALQSLPLAVGAVLALSTVRLTFGYFLPDTALAKSGSASLKPLSETGHLLLSSLNLGIGVLLLWFLSAALLLRASMSSKPAAPRPAVMALCNAILPLTLTLACLRGQFVQGIRYLLWCLVFSTLWNILQIDRLGFGYVSRTTQQAGFVPRSGLRAAVALTGLFLLTLLPVEIHFVRPALKGRGATFTQLRSTPLSLLHNDRIMAADVGYVGYFTGAAICDVEGLVDGRAFASKTKAQRIRTCATSSPDVLFLNDLQLAEASSSLDLGRWSLCRTYDFAGVTVIDRHYLMVPTTEAAKKCAALGSEPPPYLTGLPTPAPGSITAGLSGGR